MSFETWKGRARALKCEAYTLYLTVRDPRVPWYARAVAFCVVAYALSPIDLIPDPIPVLGYLDDLLLVPLGVALAVKLVPPEVLAEHREAARALLDGPRLKSWVGGLIVVLLWVTAIVAVAWWALHR